ncbi:toxin glutamine deamidase domain-containing protein [Nocardia pneumoniae]|uniref:toxin glutamine deamidase domain-containing protein n=1 Tax=Nocardia pneumoniae TaxID=228601 RepID=UPI0012F66498|nr:toxin glutamine deamidase domain-containing protein [Nocardia pneumoniae]
MSYDDVIRGLQDGSLVIGSYGVHKTIHREALRQTPDELDPEYLTEVVDHNLRNHRVRRRYASVEPDAFEPGCPDSRMPDHLTRTMPGEALDHAAAPIDPTRLVVSHHGDGLSPVWRDRSEGDAFLDARNALFRMDSRGPEIFGVGFAPRDPSNLNIGAHVGHTGPGQADGFVSLSRSPEHTIARETDIARDDLNRLADEGQLTRLSDGTFRQTMYMHELYHPHGIDVDATFHDATAHSRYQTGSHREAEVLAPGGISGDTVYRVWPREIIVDASGNLVSVTVGDPIYNPRFAHLDNPRFADTHNIPSLDQEQQDGEHAENGHLAIEYAPQNTQTALPEPPPHRSGFDPDVHRYVAHFNDGRVIPHDPFYYGEYNPHIGRYQPTPQEIEAANAYPLGESPHDIQVRNWLDAQSQQHANYRAPESQPPPRQDPWRSTQAPESLSPIPRLSSTPPHAESAPPMWAHQDPNYLANSQRRPDWWPRTEHPVPPHIPDTRTQVADLPSMRAPESLPPPTQIPSPPQRVAEPQPLTSLHQPSPPPSNPAPHETRQPAPPPRQQSEHTTDNREPRQHTDPRIERNTGSEPRRQSPHDPVPLDDPRSSARHTEVLDHRRPIDPETQRALEARNARENYRRRAPEDGRVIGVRPNRATGVPAYEMRRYAEGTERIAMLGVRIHLEAGAHISPQEMRNLIENAQLATDRAFNYGRRLLNGDWLMVDVVFTNDPSTAHLSVNVDHGPGGPRTWHPHDTPDVLANHLREHLGLPVDSQNRPTVRPEDIRQISNDIAAANTPTRFTGLPETRFIGRNRLDHLEDRAYQEMVEDSLRDGDRFTRGADPRTHPYGRLVNDGGPRVQGRRNNCLDCALSALASFFGSPQVSRPRWRDLLSDGTVDDRTGEQHGLERAAQWLGSDLSSYANHGLSVPDQFAAVHDSIAHLGPGSAALIVNEWHARDSNGNLRYDANGHPITEGTHATVVVYPPGASGPVWWDPQSGETSDHPPTRMVNDSTRLWFTPIPPDQGVDNAAAAHRGPSGSVPGRDIQSRTEVPAPPVRERVGLRPDPDTGGERRGTGTRLDEIGDRFRDRRSDRVSELVGTNGDGRLHGGETDRTAADGRTGVPAAVDGEHRTDSGRPDRSGVPGTSVAYDIGAEHRTPSDHRQADPALPDEHFRDPSDVRPSESVGIRQQEPGRDLAATRDVRVLDDADERSGTANPAPISAQVTSPNPHRQVPPIPARGSAPADPGRSRDHSSEPDDRRNPPNPAPGPSAEDARRYDPAFIENLRITNPTPDNRPDTRPVERSTDPNAAAIYAQNQRIINPTPDNRPETRPVERSTAPNAAAIYAQNQRIINPTPDNRPETRPVERSTDPNAAAIYAQNQRIINPTPDNRPETRPVERSAELDPRDSGVRGEQGRMPVERLIDNVRDRVAQDPKFELSYNNRELNALIEHGRRLGIDDRGIANLIQIGSRLAKPITADVLAQHMENWANVVSDRGYPYRFENDGHFNAFARDLDRIIHDAGFGDHGVFIQGSSLRSPHANDIDIAVVIDRDRFHEILVERYDGRIATKATDAAPASPLTLKGLTRSELQELAQRIHENPKAYNNQAHTFSNAVRKGVIRSTHDISKSLKAAGKEIQSLYPELNIEDISLIVPGSDFDSSPELPVVETTDKDRAQELTRRLEAARELEFQRDRLDERRGQLLAGLDPHTREIVQLSRDLAETNRIPNTAEALRHAQARDALERIREALGGDAPLTRASEDIARAKENLAAAQQLELHSRLDALRELPLGEHRGVVAQIVELDVRERNLPATIQLEFAERRLVEVATREVLEFRHQQVGERTRSVQHDLNRAREYEQALARGQAPELGEVIRHFEAIQHVIRHEQAMEARGLEALGLDPAHRRLVTQALDADRARTLGKTAETLGKEIVRQHHNEIVGQSRVLQLTPDQARDLNIQTYSLCLDLTPTNYDHSRGVYVYEPPGRPPVRVPHDSLERRYAEAVRAIRDGLSPQAVEIEFLRSIGHATPAEEATRQRPENSPRVSRARALELERARQFRLERER